MNPNVRPKPQKIPLALILVFLFVMIVLSIGDYIIYRNQKHAIIAQESSQLAAICRTKANQIDNWKAERIKDATSTISQPSMVDTLDRILSKRYNRMTTDMKSWMTQLAHQFDYEEVSLFTATGELVFTTAGNDATTHLPDQKELSEIRGPKPFMGPIHRSASGDYLSLIVPFFMNGKLTGIMVFTVSPEKFLFPLVRQWPTSSRTGESLLFQKTGDNLICFSSPEAQKRIKRNGKPSEISTAMMSGHSGVLQGYDYRGVQVQAFVIPVSDMSWFVQCKKDIREILYPIRERFVLISLIILVLMLWAGAIILVFWRNQEAAYYRKQLQSETQLDEQRRKWMTLLENMPGMGYRCMNDADRTLEMVGSSAETFLGSHFVSHDSVSEIKLQELVHPEDRASVMQEIKRSELHLEPYRLVYRLVSENRKRPLFVLDQGRPVPDQEDNVVALEGVLTDITEERRQTAIHRALNDINAAADEISGVSLLFQRIQAILSQFMDTSSFAVALHDHQKKRYQIVWQASSTGTVESFPAEGTLTDYVRKTRRPLMVGELEIEKLLDAGAAKQLGAPAVQWLGIPLIVRNVCLAVMLFQSPDDPDRYDEEDLRLLEILSNPIAATLARKQTESALMESEERYRLLTEHLPLGVYRTTPEGDLLFANQALIQILGAGSQEELLNHNAGDFYTHKGKRMQLMARWGNTAEPFVADVFQMTTLDGRQIWVHDKSRTILNEMGEIAYFDGVLEDITERKNLEMQLQQAQKLEAVGKLAGGIAHDFNNLLTPIIGYAELLAKDMNGQFPASGEKVHNILKAAESARKLISQILAFSRKQTLEMSQIDLNDLLSEMESLIRRTLRETIEIRFLRGQKIKPIMADPLQLQQVIMNLLINSQDAMPEGGLLTLETSHFSTSDSKPLVADPIAPGDYTCLTVSDTGIGMDDATLSNIFDPFFTTKERGKGTGLGLATVYGIVKQHNGYISTTSRVGRGTSFELYFPASPLKEKQASIQEQASPISRGNGETLLVVEDNETVRTLAENMLKEFNYTVIVAASPEEALSLAMESSSPIELLVTDVIMPGMDGKKLYEHLKQVISDLRVVYMSGYTADIINPRGVLAQETFFVQKPFTAKSLINTIHAALRADPPSS